MTKNYYEILQVEKSASEAEIKAAFKRLAKIHHPDKNLDSSEATARFQTLKNAYDTLVDPFKRRQYDRALRPVVGSGPRARAPPEPPKSSSHHDRQGIERLEKKIADLGASLDRLQVRKAAMDHDIWAAEGLLAKTKAELGNLGDKGCDEAAATLSKGKREFKFASWFTSGESAQVKEARERREAERNAVRAGLQAQVDQAAAAMAALRSQDEVLVAQIMGEMRELAKLNIERESLAQDQ